MAERPDPSQIDPRKIEDMIKVMGAPSLSQIEDELYKGKRNIPSLFPGWLFLRDTDFRVLKRFPVIIRVHGILGIKLRFSLQTMAMFKNLKQGLYNVTWDDYGISFGNFEITEDGQQVTIMPTDGRTLH